MNAVDLVIDWKARGQFLQILKKKVFYVDNGAADAPVLVILHGYPSSSFDYIHVLPILTQHFRVIVHDHVGFGLSQKPPDYSYSLMEQADVALQLWADLGLTNVHLLAHDYGTSVATEILARKAEGNLNITIESVTLSNGSIHIEMAKLKWIQIALRHRHIGPLVAKFSTQFIYVHQMRRLWSDRSKCDVEELKALWLMNSADGGISVIPKITQYLRERVQFWDRWIGALKVLDIPSHILWAQDDPVAVKAIGEQIHKETPGSTITRLQGIGHYPMLENGQLWASEVVNFLKSLINPK